MKNKIIIAGGSGFLGQILENYLIKQGYRVQILTRKPVQINHVLWDAKTLGYWTEELENAKAIINLTGKSVDCRYNDANKALIYSSRIDSTRIIGQAINSCRNPPKTWINSSTATIYRHSLDKEMTEKNGVIGNDFSMNIAKGWEKEFYNHKTPTTRKTAIRTSIVLGKNGGALVPLKKITKLLMGGKQGDGKQKVSFIHELDFARAVEYILVNNDLSGCINVTAAVPTNNYTLMKTLRKYLKVPFGISQPKWLLKIGAYIIGSEAELVLKSRNVVPKRLLDHGFKFQYKTIESVIKNILT